VKASVIILAWNGMGYLEACLNAVLAQDYPDFEVIVVDNDSTDGSADFVAAQYPQVRLIRNERNLGFAAGNNIGLRAADGDVLVLLNQDTEARPGWLAALVEAVQDPTVGIVGCKLLYPDGTIQHAGGFIADERGLSGHFGHRESDAEQYNVIRDTDFVTGAAIALTRATLARIGPLDEGFARAYYEDVDWCYRARAAGLRVFYYPQAVAVHYVSTTLKEGSDAYRASFHAGRLRFLFKHRSLDDLQTTFMTAESVAINALEPGGELEALREALVGVLFALPDIVHFRLCDIGSNIASSLVLDALLRVAMDLRELCVKERPFQASQTASDEGETWDSRLVLLHNQWQITPHTFHSEMPVLGKGIATFRKTWLNVAARWYVDDFRAQQCAFNASVTQLLSQIAANTIRGQQENAQHVRELNVLLSEVLHLRMRVAELEAKLIQRQSESE